MRNVHMRNVRNERHAYVVSAESVYIFLKLGLLVSIVENTGVRVSLSFIGRYNLLGRMHTLSGETILSKLFLPTF